MSPRTKPWTLPASREHGSTIGAGPNSSLTNTTEWTVRAFYRRDPLAIRGSSLPSRCSLPPLSSLGDGDRQSGVRSSHERTDGSGRSQRGTRGRESRQMVRGSTGVGFLLSSGVILFGPITSIRRRSRQAKAVAEVDLTAEIPDENRIGEVGVLGTSHLGTCV